MAPYEDDVERFDARAKAVAGHLKGSSDVLVVGHIDADGISATSIAKLMLDRAGVRVRCRCVKKLDDEEVARIEQEDADTVLLVDLGSGMGTKFKDAAVCIADHHAPDVRGGRAAVPNGGVKKVEGRKAVPIGNGQRQIDQPHLVLNPMDFGIDGSREISGAGVAYWIAKRMDPGNKDLAALAVVGAVGDFQDNDAGKLIGLNATIAREGIEAGVLEVAEDVRLYGRETRPLMKFVQYSDLPLPWISSWESCRDLFRRLNISLGTKECLRTWSSLSSSERGKVTEALEMELVKAGRTDFMLRGESYALVRERPGTEMRDAKEYATLLNSCGRHDEAGLGLELCTTPRDDEVFAEILRKVKNQLRLHRENIKEGIGELEGALLINLNFIQYYRTGDGFGMPQTLETTLGTVLGMVLSSGKVPDDKPLFAFAFTEDGKLKVSARGTKYLVARGLDLSEVMKRAAEAVDGVGGGHNIAAGATIPIGMEEAFLGKADEIVSRQFGR
ncbi:MAG: DHH family phosphoesterase [Methanomassiliicoccales archaeon]|jgi:RecJ-like exonuclease